MRWMLIGAVIVLGASFTVRGQKSEKDNQRSELFTSYFSTDTPITRANLPPKTCQAVISQADKLIAMSDKLESVDTHDLSVASLNLRACATSELARLDRDLAVGLYGEVVSELERRQR